jgi:DNA repair protein RecO (recombination protein O)
MARQRLYRASGLVLRRTEFGEADRLLVLLTRERGKLRAIAKGVRRPTSRHSGNLELFAEVDLLLARGRELEVVSQSALMQPFRALREDLALVSYAYYLVEVTDAMLEPSDPAEEPYELLRGAFEALEQGARPALLTTDFLLRLLDAVGFRPELFACVRCRAALEPVQNSLSPDDGGVLCPACGPRAVGARPISADALKVLRHLQRGRRLGEFAIPLAEPLLEQVERQVRLLVEYHLDRRLRSPEFIARLRELGDQAAAVARPELV